jgi:altronate dehydratase
MPSPLDLQSIGRIPAQGDNVAVAIRRIEIGTSVLLAGAPRMFAHTVLEGHRFAVEPIGAGQNLLSWGLPFGVARRAIAPGEYVCNQATLDILSQRDLAGARLPAEANFENRVSAYAFDAAAFRPSAQVAPADDGIARTFQGYPRPAPRGAGVRNLIVILGLTSRTASYARLLAERLQPQARAHPTLDGIVAVGHTEGDTPEAPNNQPELLRTLAGFMLNPNVGAVLAVDYGVEAVNHVRLREYMQQAGYALESVRHRFLTLPGHLATALAEGEAIVRDWIPLVAAQAREPVPLSELRIGLQCGGSDAFSGISANPLVGAVGREVIRHGGRVNLAETDELVGAESYILRHARSAEVARAFLEKIARFKDRLGWHGATVEGNPSGGNRFRGLYNINLKSLGAAMKKHPEVRLDHVIDYGERMPEPGFYFMNSPGNDLESVAGQVAAGCNLIFFTTGNGSVTNFPFVPTIKVTSTTRRHELLRAEMDVNAGAYLDGTPMDQLCGQMWDLVQRVASGERTRGERAGHAQVSIWREWRQTDSSRLTALRARPVPSGLPIRREARPGALAAAADARFSAFPLASGGFAADRVGLVLPTSMCSSQIARLAAERLNASGLGQAQGLTRFIALPHTEGCGFAGESLYALLQRTYRGYAMHPSVAAGLFLEHGCEKIPNDVMRRELTAAGVDPARFGWASVQLDGGMDKVLAKIEGWFASRLDTLPPAHRQPAGLAALSVALMTEAPIVDASAEAFGALTALIVEAGGSILIAETDPLLALNAYRRTACIPDAARPTLAYGQTFAAPGFHLVATETRQWTENLTGLSGCGAQIAAALVRERPRPGHPLVPLVQVAEASQRSAIAAGDIDGFFSGLPAADAALLLTLILAAGGGTRSADFGTDTLVEFQLTRGLLGVST